MTNDYKFFHEFFDGQITKPETQKFKMFKILLFSIMSAIGIFTVIMGYSGIIPLLILMTGMLWNVYVGFSSKLANVFSIIVAFLYFFIACQFSLYANCLVYVAIYIPLQNIATAKDYSEGDFIQIKKYITESNRLLLAIFVMATAVLLALFDFAVGARFVYLDALSAAFLVVSALLKNERYSEYYVLRFLALGCSLALWICVLASGGTMNTLLIIFMYMAYVIYDSAMLIYQYKTYTNQFLEKQKEVKKIHDKKLAEEKIKIYEKMQKSANFNEK